MSSVFLEFYEGHLCVNDQNRENIVIKNCCVSENTPVLSSHW